MGENANSRQACRGRIVASCAVCPEGRFAGMAATGGIVAVPTEYPVMFILPFCRGRRGNFAPILPQIVHCTKIFARRTCFFAADMV